MKSNPQISDVVSELVDNSLKIIRWKYIAATSQDIGTTKEAKGLPEGYFTFDHPKLEQLLDLVKPMLKDAQATQKIEAQNSGEIIKLIKEGKITVENGINLMNLMKTKLELEEQENKVNFQKQMFDSLNDIGIENNDD